MPDDVNPNMGGTLNLRASDPQSAPTFGMTASDKTAQGSSPPMPVDNPSK